MEALGRHILVEFFNCLPAALNEVPKIEAAMVHGASIAGATVLSSDFHYFSPHGVSGAVIIQESHLTIHTWPEYRYAAADFFTCGDSVDPWKAFEHLKEALGAENYSVLELHRGTLNLLQKIPFNIESARATAKEQIKKLPFARSVWHTDKSDRLALSLRSKGPLLYDKTSKFQRTRIFDTVGFGRALMIDNMFTVTERDETHYHEMITHPAIFAHGKVQNVLVIGGGDGGAIREVFRHPKIKKVILVEIDQNVIEASKLFLPQLSQAFEDPRLELHIADGVQFAAEAPEAAFDLILIDASDPDGPAQGLFTETFYRNCKKALKSNGIVVAQGESPIYNQPVFVELNQCLKKVFGKGNVRILLYHIPSYISGIWSFQLASAGQMNFSEVDQNEIARFVSRNNLNYYNQKIHSAAFVLPNYVARMIGEM